MEKLYQIIDNNKDEMIKTLSEWIKIPSVKSESTATAPMGENINKMLEKAMKDCKNIGLEVRNFEGYACDARMGKLGVDPLAILAHIDVVPTGDNWDKDPFGATIENGFMFGRGTQDDKGPAVAALFALKAIKESNIPLKREVRLILGTDEESGWQCMDYYKKHCDMPKMGFTPDACFPVINTEKGQLTIKVIAVPSKEGLQIKKLYTGERTNVIPGKCEAIIECDSEISNKAKQIAKDFNINLSITKLNESTFSFNTTGISGHAAMPEGAKSALGEMLILLKALGVKGAISGLANAIGAETNGASLGIQVCDKTSGELTLNIGIIRIDENKVEAIFDIRFPILANHEALVKTIRDTLSMYGFSVEMKSFTPPHHVLESSELVQKLLKAYNDETGENAKSFAIGGGTYAKVLESGVAFGSIFPGEQELAHQANEKCNLDNLLRNVRIFAKAILLLAADEQ